jgi:gluconolactonase
MQFDLVASGFGLVEGPTDDEDGGLFFSDVLGGGVHHLAADGAVETVVPKRRGVGGIARHAEGGLVVSGRDVVHVRDGHTRTLLSVEGVAGWNDLCTDVAGRVYAGSLRFAVFDVEAEPVPGECWRVDAHDRASELYGGIIHANGIGLSPDGHTLYHSDTRRGVLVVHDLDDSGRASKRREIALEGSGQPDGLAFDEADCVWVAVAGGGRIDRFTPDGRLDGCVEVPARIVTSVCFAGADRRDLVAVTADNAADSGRRGSIFRGRAPIAGAPVYPARV